MRFSNFLFPESRDPSHDGRVIDETLREARLTDELGFEVIWLSIISMVSVPMSIR